MGTWLELEKIATYECDNTNRIHLFFHSETDEWWAYGQSAYNLQHLVPEVAKRMKYEMFEVAEVFLPCVSIDSKLTERYELPCYCTLMDNDYAELQMERVEDV